MRVNETWHKDFNVNHWNFSTLLCTKSKYSCKLLLHILFAFKAFIIHTTNRGVPANKVRSFEFMKCTRFCMEPSIYIWLLHCSFAFKVLILHAANRGVFANIARSFECLGCTLFCRELNYICNVMLL